MTRQQRLFFIGALSIFFSVATGQSEKQDTDKLSFRKRQKDIITRAFHKTRQFFYAKENRILIGVTLCIGGGSMGGIYYLFRSPAVTPVINVVDNDDNRQGTVVVHPKGRNASFALFERGRQCFRRMKRDRRGPEYEPEPVNTIIKRNLLSILPLMGAVRLKTILKL